MDILVRTGNKHRISQKKKKEKNILRLFLLFDSVFFLKFIIERKIARINLPVLHTLIKF